MADVTILLPQTIHDRMKLGFVRTCSSLAIIPYLWLLPYLATKGFAESDATSISGFIANPRATGALAALSFTPLTTMWEYQDVQVIQQCPTSGKCILYGTLCSYQFFYGAFLVCTVNYVPNWLHTTTVSLFVTSFGIHSLATMYYTKPSLAGNLILLIGCLACCALPFVPGLWFWFCESIGYSMLMLFTPMEIYLKNE